MNTQFKQMMIQGKAGSRFFVTPFCDDCDCCATLNLMTDDSFAQSLLSQWIRWSEKQRAWAHFIAAKYLGKVN